MTDSKKVESAQSGERDVGRDTHPLAITFAGE